MELFILLATFRGIMKKSTEEMVVKWSGSISLNLSRRSEANTRAFGPAKKECVGDLLLVWTAAHIKSSSFSNWL